MTRACAFAVLLCAASNAGAQQETIGHPVFPLLDSAGVNVLRGGTPISPTRTCGGCHDTAYIEAHSTHVALDPLGDTLLGEEAGARHVGGGAGNDAELDCFLCHIAEPANDARVAALRAGEPAWAAAATLARAGLVRRDGDDWRYVSGAFDPFGRVYPEDLGLRDPTSRNCGQCHGLVHAGSAPLVIPYDDLENRVTRTTGLVYAAQRLVDSGMNLAGKESLTLPWDVHAERLLECHNCHFSLNNPAYAAAPSATRPAHLDFDSRRQPIGEYLRRPSHQLARGRSALGAIAGQPGGTMRLCADCHDVARTHGWLPYRSRHMSRVACEACHVPVVRAPALRAVDWTVLTPARDPRVEYRGVRGEPGDPAALVDGYRPVLLPRAHGGEPARLAPYNLVSFWYWAAGDPPRPVPRAELERAYFAGDGYHPDIAAALDTDGDGVVTPAERVLDTDAKARAVRARLEAAGVADARIVAELQPFGLHHGVAAGEWATRACERCHSRAAGADAPLLVAAVVPGGVAPVPVAALDARLSGAVTLAADGALHYAPETMGEGFYVLGLDRARAVDAAGAVVLALVFVGAAIHGAARVLAARGRNAA
jgi:hypothetical protein